MPDLRVGNTAVSNVKVGSTQVQNVYVGSNLIWSNMVLTTTPSSGARYVTGFNGVPTTATVQIHAGQNVNWTFSLVSGSNAFTTGSTTGSNTSVSLTYSGQPISSLSSVVDVTGSTGSSSATVRVTVSVQQDIFVNENP